MLYDFLGCFIFKNEIYIRLQYETLSILNFVIVIGYDFNTLTLWLDGLYQLVNGKPKNSDIINLATS